MQPSPIADQLFGTLPRAEYELGLSARYRWPVWTAVGLSFVAVHWLLFARIHNLVDTRTCIGYSPDPFLKWIPYDSRWFLVTRQLYLVGILLALILFVWQAARGLQAPLLRFGLAMTLSTSLRTATVTMIPLCRSTLTPYGPPPLAAPQMAHFLGWAFPWRSFALNDLVYSGHTAVFILIFLAAASWNRKLRAALAAFLVLMMYALIGTRGHYSVDILLAFPCATFADRLAVSALRWAAGRRPRRMPECQIADESWVDQEVVV